MLQHGPPRSFTFLPLFVPPTKLATKVKLTISLKSMWSKVHMGLLFQRIPPPRIMSQQG